MGLPRVLGDRHARLALVVVLVAPLLHAASLGWGFFADDYVHLGVLEGWLEHPTLRPWSLFDFGEYAQADATLRESGAFPWWTDEDWKGRFFRPLSSVVRWATVAACGRAAWVQHALSLALFAAVLALAWRLYRVSGLAPHVALLALALVACEDGAALPVGWLANQNTLLEALAVLLAWHCALRAERRWSTGRAWLVGALAASLAAALAKESGVVAFGLCAWLWRERLPRAALVALLLGAGYVVAWLALGFGLRSLGYPAPWTDAGTWSANLAALVVGGAAAALSPYPLDLVPLEPASRFAVLGVTALGVLVLVGPIARAARTLESRSMWLAFVVLTVLPQAGTWPSDRLLFVPMLGVAPLVAHAVLGWRASGARALRVLAWSVLVLALPLSALGAATRSITLRDAAARARAAVLDLALPRDGATRKVLLLQVPSGVVALQPTAVFAAETGTRGTSFFALQGARRALRVTRLDARTLVVESRDGPFGEALFEQVFRTPDGSLVEPAVRRTPICEVTIEPVEGRVERLRLAFDAPLARSDAPLGGSDAARDRSDVLLVGWRDGALCVLAPPNIGETLELEAPEPLVPGMP